MGAANADVVRALASSPLFADVPPARVWALAETGATRRYRAGAYLFLEGDEADSVYCVLRGRVQIESPRDDGRTLLRAILSPGQLLGELGVLAAIPRTSAALALDDVVSLRVPGEAFSSFVRSEPAAAGAMLRALALMVVEREGAVDDLLFLDLRARVAKRLLSLVSLSTGELPPNGVRLPDGITQSDLASLAGGSRENVNRAMSELQRRGLVERRGHKYVLTDVSGLRRLARV
jgi:CRP/FNR family transcriptional regulator, cyclic AMP receptor protein